ncbi:MAG: enoyl-CoA hydratase/isomerase family protein [Betaproteobacteria bacterium]
MSAVLYAKDGGVVTITLNRPGSRNALNLEMCEGLLDAAQAAAADESVRLVLVRGAGAVFCAGADLKERQGMDAAQVRERRMKGFAAYSALEALPMPAVAVVAGAAVGSGVEIAGACDFIVATPEAWFATPEAIRGTVGATQRLPRVLGARLAKDLMFTGRRLPPEEALRHGFVSRVVPAAELENEMARIVKTICDAPPGALRYAKRCVDAAEEAARAAALQTEINAIEEQLKQGGGLGKA